MIHRRPSNAPHRPWIAGPPARPRAFTLIELLVVISIIALAVGASFPVITAMTRSTYVSTAINAVGIGVSAARGYADRDITFNADLTPDITDSNIGQYSGVAALFTPASEIRLVENVPNGLTTSLPGGAGNPGGASSPFFLERFSVNDSGDLTYDVSGNSLPRSLNGFTDISVDYVTLPGGAGVAGIKGPPSGGSSSPVLVAPPFAVWFGSGGAMIAGNQPDQFIYYNGQVASGKIDGQIDLGSDRASISNYNPDPYDPSAAGYEASHYSDSDKKNGLPFEKIDTVIGVIVFNKRDIKLAGHWWTDPDPNGGQTRWDWLKENGRFVLFTKQSGAVIREATNR